MGTQEPGRRKTWELGQREREALWRKRVGAWRQSASSQAAYCRQQALAPADFSWWKHELARRDGLAAASPAQPGSGSLPQFVPLRITAENTPGACALELRNGRRLQIDGGTDPRWVAELAAALEGGGRRPLPPELPRQRIEYTLPEEQRRCSVQRARD